MWNIVTPFVVQQVFCYFTEMFYLMNVTVFYFFALKFSVDFIENARRTNVLYIVLNVLN